MWYVYILKCSDGSYYVGHTDSVESRVERHNAGQAAQWTACRLPVRLVFKEVQPTEQQAMKREIQIKRWSRQKKEALVAGDFLTLKVLSKSR
ncbi:MAG: GIY-YIG nuclease family protein [Phycisphaerae bacterium]|jgi:putative endonuclease